MKPEALFETKVLALAAQCGWHAHTERTTQTKAGKYQTAVRGNTGYPDVTLAHPKHGAFWLELKAGYAMPTPEQVAWIRKLPPMRAFVVSDAGYEQFVVPLLTRGTITHRAAPGTPGYRLAWAEDCWVGPIAVKAAELHEDFVTGGVSAWVRKTAKQAARPD